jgi:hypothetical protein
MFYGLRYSIFACSYKKNLNISATNDIYKMDTLHTDVITLIVGHTSTYCELLALMRVNRQLLGLARARCSSIAASACLTTRYYRPAAACTCRPKSVRMQCSALTAAAFCALFAADESERRAGILSAVHIFNDRTEYRTELGLLHRAGGRPAVEFRDGSAMYWVFGQLHRMDGPAMQLDDAGEQKPQLLEYWVRGQRHRADGPAVQCAGRGVAEYWSYGEQVAPPF